MPTTRPRYTVTDTGELREMLDVAGRAWPGVDRKDLLLKLAAEGREAIAQRLEEADGARRQEAQRAALLRASTLVDVEALLADTPWM